LAKTIQHNRCVGMDPKANGKLGLSFPTLESGGSVAALIRNRSSRRIFGCSHDFARARPMTLEEINRI
jgi:hypothetical protein